MDVLLVSPRHVAGSGAPIGDHTYTDTLLRCPPDRVHYHHYEDLLGAGIARPLRWPYRLSARLRALGVLPPDTWDQYLESDFTPDLVHIQAFSATVRFPRAARDIPVVLGTSTGSTSDLREYLGWPSSRTARARRRKRLYLGLVGAHDTALRPGRAARVLVWSEYARRLHLQEGHVTADRIETLPPGLPVPDALPARSGSGPLTMLFVGREFDRKNGWLVVEAFRTLRQRHPGVRLLLIGRPDGDVRLSEPGIEHHLDVDRRELFERIYPQADVLVLPSRAEGFGMVLLEAMANGLPVLATKTGAIPEIVEHARTGFLLDPSAIAADLRRYFEEFASNAELVRRMSAAARTRFEAAFTVTRHNERLRAVYDAALSARA